MPSPTPKQQLLLIVLATVCGTAATLSFAPMNWQATAPIALGILFYWAARSDYIWHNFSLGLAFGFSFFSAGLWWIDSALAGHIGLPGSAAALLTILFALFLAVFPALALALATVLTPSGGISRLLSLAASWTFLEWIRSWLLSGFPWLSLGYSQIPDGWLAPWAPIVGIFGVTFALTLMVVAVLTLLTLRKRRGIGLILLLLLASAPFINNVWKWTPPAGTLTISLLQGNVKQSLKWEAEEVRRALADYIELAEAAEGRIIIMPETALPMRIEDLPDGYIERLQRIATERYGAVITGLFLEEEEKIYNAAVVLNERSDERYRKIHLTPYGEYLPFADVLQPLLGAADIPYANLSAGATPAPPLRLPDGILAAIFICYEAIFGNEVRQRLPAALFLINITNDAWFDQTAMPQQHLQMAQARALESGRWLVRAANTGITAVINAKGQVVATLPEQVRGVLTEQIILQSGSTPYVIWGDAAIVLLVLLILFAGALGQFHLVPKRRGE
ncbi:MAG: apolipoprotein N-acyltransferase [Proteobacteria bacterium]|nr:apolipoprotein N-acyltransferase [Pseudomonadota bacterium]